MSEYVVGCVQNWLMKTVLDGMRRPWTILSDYLLKQFHYTDSETGVFISGYAPTIGAKSYFTYM
jgi:hypothetical protein